MRPKTVRRIGHGALERHGRPRAFVEPVGGLRAPGFAADESGGEHDAETGDGQGDEGSAAVADGDADERGVHPGRPPPAAPSQKPAGKPKGPRDHRAARDITAPGDQRGPENRGVTFRSAAPLPSASVGAATQRSSRFGGRFFGWQGKWRGGGRSGCLRPSPGWRRPSCGPSAWWSGRVKIEGPFRPRWWACGARWRRRPVARWGRAVGAHVGGVSVGGGEAGWRRPGGGWPSMRGTAWRTPGRTVGRMQTGAADGEGAALTRMQAVLDGTPLAFHLPLVGR